MNPTVRAQAGIGLIELVLAIVVLSVATSAIVLLTSDIHRRSADPMLQAQAVAIAQSYLEEMSSRSFCDPDWDPDANPATSTSCRSSCTQAVCSACRGNGATTEAVRASYDDICDYDGLSDSGAIDQNGTAWPGLSDYTVTAAVQTSGVTFNGLQAASGQVAMLRIQVSHPSADPVVLTAYRTNSE